MSAWCLVTTNATHGKNQSQIIRWAKVLEVYETTRLENPNEIGARNTEALRQRYKILSKNASKWISCYKAVLSRPRKSGTNDQDLEDAAQKLYFDENRSRYNDLKVFKNVMSMNPKWSLDNYEERQPQVNVDEESATESGESLKRSRVN
ncbi:hypothetical protein RND81_14G090200 [Saponaria officinalis]|uniref:Uncharacterized protein n=1 Tax=Saponaria officinalis TaxID=3572 RepID=A0AAW1GJZ5_SAPOF